MSSRLAITGILSCILVSPLFAADGALNIKGRVIQNSCALESSTYNVSLGEVKAADFRTDGGVVNQIPFTLKLLNCPQSTVIVNLEGPALTSGCGFALDNADSPETAKNVSLAIWDYYRGSVVGGRCFDNNYRWTLLGDSMEFRAGYWGHKGDIKPGKANVTVQISITQL